MILYVIFCCRLSLVGIRQFLKKGKKRAEYFFKKNLSVCKRTFLKCCSSFEQAEDNERYKLGELKKDLKHCMAETVFLIVDQSHAGRIADAISGSQDHQNVQVLASSLAHEYSFGSNFTDFISSYNHSHTCLSNVLEVSEKRKPTQ